MTEINVGKKIYAIRIEKGISVRKLASMADITPSMLSQIEKNQVNPSINTMRAIADCLETPLYTFFQEDEDDVFVVTPGERRSIGQLNETDVRYELLTPDTKGDIEFCLMKVPSGMSTYQHKTSHDGEEVAYVDKGREVILEIGDKEFVLHRGDSVRIPRKTPHIWHNRSKTEVEVIFAITPFSF